MFAFKHACCIKSTCSTGDIDKHVKIGSTCKLHVNMRFIKIEHALSMILLHVHVSSGAHGHVCYTRSLVCCSERHTIVCTGHGLYTVLDMDFTLSWMDMDFTLTPPIYSCTLFLQHAYLELCNLHVQNILTCFFLQHACWLQ